MSFRPAVVLLVCALSACAGSSDPDRETAASGAAIRHFFGPEVAEPTKVEGTSGKEAKPTEVARSDAEEGRDVMPASASTAHPGEKPDAVQYFFGEPASEARSPEPAMGSHDGGVRKSEESEEKVGAFEYFFGAKEEAVEEKPPV